MTAPTPAPAPKKPSTKSSLLGGAAFLAGYLSGGAGVGPHLVVEGSDTVDSDWNCEVVGPALSGTRICHPKQDDEQTDADTPIVVPATDAGH